MDRYKKYGVEDFVWDIAFRQWVLAPTREDETLWTAWLIENPERKHKVDQARQIVSALRIEEQPLEDQEIRDVIADSLSKINNTERYEVTTLPLVKRFYSSIWFKMAASIVILIGVGLYVKSYYSSLINPSYQAAGVPETEIVIEKVNSDDQDMLVQLPDQSTVTLSPGSKIRYVKEFTHTKRDVTLIGEAFFDVAKDPHRSFFVYANELITKVLGTSFRVKAYPSTSEVTVEVKTGRVSVFAKSDPELHSKLTKRELEGLVLTPNQKVTFMREAVKMVKTLVESPEMVLPKSQLPHFVFEDIPASEAFAKIGKAYGIDIIYDEAVLRDCPLTAELDSQPLNEKLSILCKAVEADYEIVDGQIIIHSRGCK